MGRKEGVARKSSRKERRADPRPAANARQPALPTTAKACAAAASAVAAAVAAALTARGGGGGGFSAPAVASLLRRGADCDATPLAAAAAAVGGFVHPAVEIREGPRGRGWFAAAPIAEGERIFTVPVAATVYSGDYPAPRGATEDHRVAIGILAELARGGAKASLMCLPDDCPSVLCWSPSELAMTGDPVVISQAEDHRREAMDVRHATDWKLLGWDGPPTEDVWLWAVGMAMSRSFGESFAQGGRSAAALVPIVDLMNHHPGDGVTAVSAWAPKEKATAVSTARQLEAGEEILWEYNRGSLFQVFYTWGFVADHPEHHYFSHDVNPQNFEFDVAPDVSQKMLLRAGAKSGKARDGSVAISIQMGKPLPPAGLAPFRACALMKTAPETAALALKRRETFAGPHPDKRVEAAALGMMRGLIGAEQAKPFAADELAAPPAGGSPGRLRLAAEYRRVSRELLANVTDALDNVFHATFAKRRSAART